jgi:hypothetical protein
MTEIDMDDSYSENTIYNQPYQNDDVTLVSDSTVVSSISPTRKKQRDYLDAYRLNDKMYHKLSRKGSKDKVGLYTTYVTPGTLIRDAITGATNNDYQVGSKSEDLFFKVVFATGEFGSDPKTAFFDSPEQYERHLNENISQETKNIWTNKFALAREHFGL